MFRQILVDPPDCDYHRFVWICPDKDVVAQRLLTVTYGTAYAPYLADKVISQLFYDEKSDFPLDQTIFENKVYVNNVFLDRIFSWNFL